GRRLDRLLDLCGVGTRHPGERLPVRGVHVRDQGTRTRPRLPVDQGKQGKRAPTGSRSLRFLHAPNIGAGPEKSRRGASMTTRPAKPSLDYGGRGGRPASSSSVTARRRCPRRTASRDPPTSRSPTTAAPRHVRSAAASPTCRWLPPTSARWTG